MAAVRPLFRCERLSALFMLGALGLALVIANSPFAYLYRTLHHTPVHIHLGSFIVALPLYQWINEGLMVFFFLLVGLEIKRQFVEGHLATAKCAALPVFAAFGGMLLPALIYVGLNAADAETIRGWAVPTATDIVLALGVLSLLGSRIPVGLKVFLTALAIFDDIGAVLVIGLFYGHELSWIPLTFAGAGLGGLLVLNVLRVRLVVPFVAIGLGLWLAMVKSGVAPSLAGILIAMAVPYRVAGCDCSSPLRETERRLHPWCVLGVVPVFVFFNAGIAIEGAALPLLATSAPLGIIAGLFFGKQLGVFGAAWLAVRLRLGEIPRGVSWPQLYGVALLSGIGFTMSMFVVSLAYSDTDLLAATRLAVLLGSVLSALAGAWMIHLSTKRGSRVRSAMSAQG